MTANDSKSTPKKAERHPLALLAETWRAAAGPVYGPEEAVFQQCADELESALRAQADRQVMVPRETVENLLAGWDEGLWGPETQDAGVPDTIIGLVDVFRAALAQAGGEG